jgi:hypothetical protein
MMQFVTPLLPLRQMLVSTWDKNNYMRFLQPHSIPLVDIVLTKDAIHTLTNIVVAYPTRTDLLPPSCAIQGFVTSDAAQTKEKNYCNRHPTNQFFP